VDEHGGADRRRRVVVPLPPIFATPIKANPELTLIEGNPTGGVLGGAQHQAGAASPMCGSGTP